MTTTAVPTADGSAYILNGDKLWCTNGPNAELLVVMAQTPAGARAFLVEGDSPGLVRHPMSKIGRRIGDNAEIFFDNVRVPKGFILAPNPPGRSDIGTHVTIAAITLGLGRAALEETIKYTQERVSGGKPIIQHQAVGLYIADMAMNLEAAGRLIWTAAWVKDHPEAIADGTVEAKPYETMATAFTGTAVQRIRHAEHETNYCPRCQTGGRLLADRALSRFACFRLRYREADKARFDPVVDMLGRSLRLLDGGR